MSNHSIVRWYPDLEKHRCGYCKQLNTNCSYGMWAEKLTVEDYQNLIDRGWRRSGKYCYKPIMDKTCCPSYTIKCAALNIKLSKSQKKVLKRVNKYLSESNKDNIQENSQEMAQENFSVDSAIEMINVKKPTMNIDINKIETHNFNLTPKEINSEERINISRDEGLQNSTKSLRSDSNSSDQKNYKPGTGADISKPPCKKAKLIRLEKRQIKMAAKGINSDQCNSSQNQGKSLEEFISEVSENPAHRLKICLVRSRRSNLEKITSEEYPVYKKYQMFVHGDPPEKCSTTQFRDFLCYSPLQIILKRMDKKDPTFLTSAKLFEKYQIVIHNEPIDECDVDSFAEFVVESPLKYDNPPGGPSEGYGSFHQQYWLDDKLIAVGVIDILPRCVSSVYFFYDPDFRHLTLGTYGSLREVEFTRNLNRTAPDLKYYYMGFYIHSCPKMRYKANLTPSYLLCPETYFWFPIEKCIPLLEIKPYSRLNEYAEAVDENKCEQQDVGNILILVNYRTCVTLNVLKRELEINEDDYFNFANLVGKKCISKFVVISDLSMFS